MNNEPSQFDHPEIDNLEYKLRRGRVRKINGKYVEISDKQIAAENEENKQRANENNIEVDPEFQKEAKLGEMLSEAETRLSRAQKSLQKATDIPSNATMRGLESDPEIVSAEKIEQKAASVREAFTHLNTMKEATSALSEAGNLANADTLLSSKEEGMNEKIRDKSTERAAAHQRGDAAGAEILDKEREELITMRETISNAKQELKNL